MEYTNNPRNNNVQLEIAEILSQGQSQKRANNVTDKFSQAQGN